MIKPLVTIVVVSYNHEKYILDCLASVKSQSYKAIECIIVDNASSDRSAHLIEEFVKQNSSESISFSAHFSSVNMHLTGAMFFAFWKSEGSFICFVDGDDLLLPDFVCAHLQAFLMCRVPVGASSTDMYQLRGQEVVVGAGKSLSRFVSAHGRVEGARLLREKSILGLIEGGLFQRAVVQPRDVILVPRSATAGWHWSATSGLCFRREAVAWMFRNQPALGAGTDNYLIRGISAITGSILIDLPLACYRIHSDNMFSRHPEIENVTSFDKEQLSESDRLVAEEIINCYISQMGFFAARIEYHDSFIEAVDQISRSGPGLTFDRKRYASYTHQFLDEHHHALVEHFGARRVAWWRGRFAKQKLVFARRLKDLFSR